MAKPPLITSIKVHEFSYAVKDMARTKHSGWTYSPGQSARRRGFVLQIETDSGVVGEYATRRAVDVAAIPMFARYLIGSNALQRERIYQELKRILRQVARLGLGIIDVTLWDIAGKYYGAPIYELLGGYRTRLPAYASTYFGDETKGGLNSPEAYADFAEQCLGLGYPGFKIHGWERGPVEREIATVQAVARRVEGKMDLMLDPGCALSTFGDAWKVGRALDEAGFFWYEDPFKDGGVSAFAHRKLRQLIKTPLLLCEYHRNVEPHMDFLLADATDFLRADPELDGGITGAMRIAYAAEGLGVDVELHAPGPAQRHCMAAMRNTNYYEMALVHPKGAIHVPQVYRNYRDGLDAIDLDGCVPVPEGPGLGVEVDWDYVKKHRTGLVEYD